MSAREGGIFALKFARWGVLTLFALTLVLMFKRPAAVAESLPGAEVRLKSRDFVAKWTELEQARQRGDRAEARFTSGEINAALEQTLAEDSPSPSPHAAISGEPLPQARPARVLFAGDRVTGQFIANLRGKDVYLTLSGKLGTAGGYLVFDPLEIRIGDMPVPVALVKPALQAKLMEPETHARLKLPDYIADVRVAGDQLVVVEK